MRIEVDGLPDWVFDLEETSNGAYTMSAVDLRGRSVHIEGGDPDELTVRCREAVQEFIRRNGP